MEEFRSLLRRYALGAWRKRWFAIAVSWMVCVGGWVFVSTIPNQYEASARLYVDSDAVLTPLLRGLALDNTPVSQLDVLQRTLLSRPNLEKLISKTDLELGITGPADLEDLVRRLGFDIKITPQTHNLFTISYRNSTPKLAYDVVQTILTIFVESKVGNTRSDMENARVFLQQQIASYRAAAARGRGAPGRVPRQVCRSAALRQHRPVQSGGGAQPGAVAAGPAQGRADQARHHAARDVHHAGHADAGCRNPARGAARRRPRAGGQPAAGAGQGKTGRAADEIHRQGAGSARRPQAGRRAGSRAATAGRRRRAGTGGGQAARRAQHPQPGL